MNCDPAQRGTLGADGVTFTEGSSASDIDFLAACTGDGAGDRITLDDFENSYDDYLAAGGADVLGNGRSKIVLEVGGSGARLDFDEVGSDTVTYGVVMGTIRGADDDDGINAHFENDPPNELRLDFHADIRTTGGARGIVVGVDDDAPGRQMRTRNFGSVVTEDAGEARTGDAIRVWSNHADVEGTNEAGATVETSGKGDRGLYIFTFGETATARVVNRGSVTTKGDLDDNRRGADAVRASNGAGAGMTEAVNEAGGTIRTEGTGARGLTAGSCNWDNEDCLPSGKGSVIAINRGSITTTGDGAARSDGGIRNAHAVAVWAYGEGTARAVNEAGGMIRTEGTAALGLSAYYEGSLGRAEAENKGDITTTGGLDSASRGSNGLQAWSLERSARAVNHEGATIVTRGVAASGVFAHIRKGTADDSATAINHGSITTRGDDFFNEDTVNVAYGVYASTRGASRASALNDETGVVETHGKGARGVAAIAYGSGDAESVNRGRITTRGDAFPIDRQGSARDTYFDAAGLGAYSPQGSGMTSARNEVGGIVETHGTAAHGIDAWSEEGAASIVNQGRVTTHQTAAVDDLPGYVGTLIGARGASAHSGSADALVENEETGRVETMGARAFGLFAEIDNDGSRTSAMARVDNRGTVITHGWNADAVVAFANNGGSADNPNHARAVNEAGATIDTEGDGSGGLVAAGILVSGSGTVDSSGSARAENRGTIMTSGSWPADGAGSAANANGVAALFFPSDPQVTIGNAGDATVTVVNTGRVTVSGAGATGLYAGTSGTGAATVTMTGGEVTASHADDPATDVDEGGVGILAETGDAGSIAVRVGGGARVEAPTAVRLVGGSGIDAVALDVIGGGTLTGRVDLTQAVNGARMTVAGGGVIDGAVDFGAGDDELVMQGGGLSSIEGTISGLETMYKRGAGAARVNDVEFSGSAVNLEQGDLILAGHLNLGEEGTVTVHDDSRLVIEVGDIIADGTRHGRITAGGGVVFQGQDDPAMSMQVASAAAQQHEAIQDRLQEAPIDVLDEGTRVMRRATAEEDATPVDEVGLKTGTGSEEQDIGTVDADGMAMVRADAGPLAVTPEPSTTTPEPPVTTPEPPAVTPEPPVTTPEPPAVTPEPPVTTPEPPVTTPEPPVTTPEPPVTTPEPPAVTPEPPVTTPEPPTPSSGGDDSKAVAFVGGSVLLAALLSDWFDSEDEDEAAAWEEQRTDGETGTSFADLRSGYSHEFRSRAGGVEGWMRAYAGDSPVLAGGAEGTVQGVAMGLDAELGRGLHFGVAALPDMAASSRPGPASGFGSSLEGSWYAARGGWRGRTLFAKTSVSHGRWRAHSLFENPAAGGVLSGALDLVQDHVGVKAGARLALSGVRATPSVSWYSGEVRQRAYTAQSAALRAEVPGLSQCYRGWKAGLELAPSPRWLGSEGTLRWRPELRVSTMRTRTADAGVFDLLQSDKAGVLSFTSRARAQGMPGTVHALGASVTAMRSQAWRLRLGYAGMEVDGEPVHAVAARLQVRF